VNQQSRFAHKIRMVTVHRQIVDPHRFRHATSPDINNRHEVAVHVIEVIAQDQPRRNPRRMRSTAVTIANRRFGDVVLISTTTRRLASMYDSVDWSQLPSEPRGLWERCPIIKSVPKSVPVGSGFVWRYLLRSRFVAVNILRLEAVTSIAGVSSGVFIH